MAKILATMILLSTKLVHMNPKYKELDNFIEEYCKK